MNIYQKVVIRVLTMTDEKTKQKAIEAAADILGTYISNFHIKGKERDERSN